MYNFYNWERKARLWLVPSFHQNIWHWATWQAIFFLRKKPFFLFLTNAFCSSRSAIESNLSENVPFQNLKLAAEIKSFCFASGTKIVVKCSNTDLLSLLANSRVLEERRSLRMSLVPFLDLLIINAGGWAVYVTSYPHATQKSSSGE